MKGEKISVITISYNSEKTIERTLRSILSQSYRPLEYVLVDGASKDGTISLIESYLPKFESAGIAVNFHSEPDEGISDAFNKGIERATGDIIGIINSDDTLHDDEVVERIALQFESDADVLCGDILWIDVENDLSYVRKSKMDLDKLKYEMVLMHPACFVRKRAYIKYGLFDVKMKYAMDKELMSRFYSKGAKFQKIDLVTTTMMAGGASDTNVKAVFNEGIEIGVRNGVPRWIMHIRKYYKFIRLQMIRLIKKWGGGRKLFK